MAHFLRQPDRRRRFRLPVDMMDWSGKDGIVHISVDAVGLMDLSEFEKTCKVATPDSRRSRRPCCWRC